MAKTSPSVRLRYSVDENHGKGICGSARATRSRPGEQNVKLLIPFTVSGLITTTICAALSVVLGLAKLLIVSPVLRKQPWHGIPLSGC